MKPAKSGCNAQSSTIDRRPPGFTWLLLIMVLSMITVPAFGGEMRRVSNGPTPRDGVRTVELKALWRVGNDESGIVFGRVPRVDTDRHGNIHVLDAQMCQVHIFSPQGDLLRTVFREGDGPGEVRGPRDMLLTPDGGVGLVLESMGMVHFVDAAGEPAGSLRFEGEGNYALVSGIGLDGGLVLAGRCSTSGGSRSIRERRNFLVRCDMSGRETAVYAETHWTRDLSIHSYVESDEMPSFNWGFDVGPDGRIYAAVSRNDYAVSVFLPDGTPDCVIEREYAPLKRTKEERERFTRMIEASMEAMPFKTTVIQEDVHPAISFFHRGLQIRSDGSLWVLSGRGLNPEKPGIMAVYDVFDRDGVFVRQVSLSAPHDANRVGIVFAGENRVIVVKGLLESLASQFGNGATFIGDEWSNPEVIVYEMGGERI